MTNRLNIHFIEKSRKCICRIWIINKRACNIFDFGPSLAVVGFVVLGFGIKLYYVSKHGSIVPFWDQWDGEAALIYIPYLESHFNIWQLIAPHNEHRILFTRLLALALLEIAGGWDTLLQMVVNAGFFALVFGFLLIALMRVLSTADRVVAALVCAGISAIPVGWENTLSGFQSQFYFFMIFSLGAFVTALPAKAFELRWIAGTGLAAISYLCAAAGALTLVPVIAVVMVQLIIGIRHGSREWIGLILQAGIVAGLLLTIPEVAAHATLRAQSFYQFAIAFSHVLAWPIVDKPANHIVYIRAIMVQLPLFLFAIWLIMKRPPPSSPSWVVAAIGAWVVVQASSFAYGRAGDALASRYLELLCVGLIVNSVALLCLIRGVSELPSLRFVTLCAAGIWLAVLANGFISNALPRALAGAEERGRFGRAQVEVVGAFLRTGNSAYLRAAKPVAELPYPLPDRLEALLSTPVIRRILPVELHGDSKSVAVGHRALLFGGFAYQSVARLRRMLLSAAAPIIGLGFAVLIMALIWVAASVKPNSTLKTGPAAKS